MLMFSVMLISCNYVSLCALFTLGHTLRTGCFEFLQNQNNKCRQSGNFGIFIHDL